MLLWVSVHSGIQDNVDADALARKGSSNPFLGPQPVIPVSPCVGMLKIREWLVRNQTEYWVTTTGMRQTKLFI
jgi:hypothetical protein